jgi:hypothetical protein
MQYAGLGRSKLYEIAADNPGLFRKSGAATLVDFSGGSDGSNARLDQQMKLARKLISDRLDRRKSINSGSEKQPTGGKGTAGNEQ